MNYSNTLMYNTLEQMAKRFSPNAQIDANYGVKDVLFFILDTTHDVERMMFLSHFTRKALSEANGVKPEEVKLEQIMVEVRKAVRTFDAHPSGYFGLTGIVKCRAVYKDVKSGIFQESKTEKGYKSELDYNTKETPVEFSKLDVKTAAVIENAMPHLMEGKGTFVSKIEGQGQGK